MVSGPGPVSMLAEGKRVLRAEAGAILAVGARLGDEFDHAVHAISCVRVLHVTGVGKSGHVGQKIAGTLASTGTPASFLHPTDAVHGDLGRVLHHDGILAISRSGECEETLAVVRAFKALYRPPTDPKFEQTRYPPILALTGVLDSSLAQFADIVLDCAAEEADPDGLAPTASTAATMAMGDALAMALKLRRGFSAEDFRKRHPAGVLGQSANGGEA